MNNHVNLNQPETEEEKEREHEEEEDAADSSEEEVEEDLSEDEEEEEETSGEEKEDSDEEEEIEEELSQDDWKGEGGINSSCQIIDERLYFSSILSDNCWIIIAATDMSDFSGFLSLLSNADRGHSDALKVILHPKLFVWNTECELQGLS